MTYPRTQRDRGGYRAVDAWRDQPATPEQFATLRSIQAERVFPDGLLAEYMRQALADEPQMTKGLASAWVTVFKACEPLATPVDTADAAAGEPGIYELHGVHYRVTRNTRTGRLNVFDGVTGEYARGVLARLRQSHRVIEPVPPGGPRAVHVPQFAADAQPEYVADNYPAAPAPELPFDTAGPPEEQEQPADVAVDTMDAHNQRAIERGANPYVPPVRTATRAAARADLLDWFAPPAE